MISKELQQGMAAEHLVAAHLILQGYPAHIASAGSPYDVIAEAEHRLWRVQVRSTRIPRSNRHYRKPVYRFSLRRGKGGHQCSGEGVDVYAFVALDINTIAYLLKADVIGPSGKLIQLIEFYSTLSERKNYCPRKYKNRLITNYSFQRALSL